MIVYVGRSVDVLSCSAGQFVIWLTHRKVCASALASSSHASTAFCRCKVDIEALYPHPSCPQGVVMCMILGGYIMKC